MFCRWGFSIILLISALQVELAYAKKIKIEWKPIEGAISYELQIQGDQGGIIHKATQDPKWQGDIPPGTYFYQIRAIDEVKRPGVWSQPRPLAVMPQAPQPKDPPDGTKLELFNANIPVTLRWEPVPGIQNYLVELKKDGQVVSKTEVSGTQVALKSLPTGKYSWRVSAVLQAGGRSPASFQGKRWESPPGDSIDFKLEQKNLELPRLVSPKGINPPPEDRQIKLKWKEVDGAQAYEIHLIKRKDLKLKRSLASELEPAKRIVVRDDSYVARVSGEGSYVWGVRALANYNENKQPQSIGPEAVSEFTLDRNAVFRGDLGYLAFSSMYAPYNYKIQNPSRGVKGSTQSTSVVFRGSGEYILHPQWAISAAMDYAQFQILQQSFSRSSYELYLKYRMNLSPGETGWYLSPKIGTELRQYNQIIPVDSKNLASGVQSNNIYAWGLAVGLDLRKQLSQKFSLGVKASYFKPMSFLSGVENAEIGGSASSRNINVGIQGLYWLNRTWGIGAGGYFEMRSIGFTTPASTTEEEVSMDAAYFFGSVIFRIWK